MKIRDLVADCNLLRGSGTAVIILSNAFERLKNLQEFEIGNGDGQLLSHRMGKFQSQYHICPTDAVNSEWRRVTGPANWMMALNAIKMGGVQLFAFQYTHQCRLHPDYFSVCSTSFLNEFKATSSLSLRRLRLNIMSPESVSEQILWDTSFVAFLDVFSNLTDLTLNNEGLPGLRTLGRVLPKFPSCPKLERLALLGFDFDPDDLVTLLVTFKRLTELELTKIHLIYNRGENEAWGWSELMKAINQTMKLRKFEIDRMRDNFDRLGFDVKPGSTSWDDVKREMVFEGADTYKEIKAAADTVTAMPRDEGFPLLLHHDYM